MPLRRETLHPCQDIEFDGRAGFEIEQPGVPIWVKGVPGLVLSCRET
jgi:hypothetical protein